MLKSNEIFGITKLAVLLSFVIFTLEFVALRRNVNRHERTELKKNVDSKVLFHLNIKR